MKDRKQWTIRTVSGVLGMLFTVLFSVSIAATNARVPPTVAHAVAAAAAQR